MDLDLNSYYTQILGSYKSVPQQIRKVSEKWAQDNLYCPKCGNNLEPYQNNMPSYDFYCNHSDEKLVLIPINSNPNRDNFQLKSTKHFSKNSFPNRILGGEYSTTRNNLKVGKVPSLILIHYEDKKRQVEDVLAVHRLSITVMKRGFAPFEPQLGRPSATLKGAAFRTPSQQRSYIASVFCLWSCALT